MMTKPRPKIEPPLVLCENQSQALLDLADVDDDKAQTKDRTSTRPLRKPVAGSAGPRRVLRVKPGAAGRERIVRGQGQTMFGRTAKRPSRFMTGMLGSALSHLGEKPRREGTGPRNMLPAGPRNALVAAASASGSVTR